MEDIRYWIELARDIQIKLNKLEKDYTDLLDEATELLEERFELKAKIKRLEEAKDNKND
jgi:cell division septum initiation protein DivIVA